MRYFAPAMGTLATKLKNGIKEADPKANYSFKLRNDTLNGMKVGCYGWITNEDNGYIVYISTSENTLGKAMFRYTHDTTRCYDGGPNKFATNLCEYCDGIVAYLNDKFSHSFFEKE